MKKWLKHPIALPVFLVLGILFLIMMGKGRNTPTETADSEYATPAIAMPLVATKVIPQVRGFGTVNPASNLNVPAEVSGEITWIHPRLKKGADLKAGTKVLQLDQRDFQLTLSKAKADLKSVETQLAELVLEERNTLQKLELTKKKLTLSESEFQRKQELSNQGAISKSTLEAEERNLINMRTELQNLELQVSLHPKQRDLLNAQASVSNATIEEQTRNLERTTINMPFDARVGEVNVEKGALVSRGNTLFIAQGKERVEIEAQISMPKMLPLLHSIRNKSLAGLSAKDRLKALNIKAEVHMVGAPDTARWQAHVIRRSDSIDPQTRTMSIVVAIDEPEQQAIVGVRPPLLKGMYMEVTLSSEPIEGWKVPRSALHQNRLYFLDDENRLHIEPAKLAFEMDDYAILANEPKYKRLVTSDLVPAVSGMLINPFEKDSSNTVKQSGDES